MNTRMFHTELTESIERVAKADGRKTAAQGCARPTFGEMVLVGRQPPAAPCERTRDVWIKE